MVPLSTLNAKGSQSNASGSTAIGLSDCASVTIAFNARAVEPEAAHLSMACAQPE